MKKNMLRTIRFRNCWLLQRAERSGTERLSSVFDAGKFLAGRAADALGGRFGRDEIGKLLFQILQLFEKLVVFAVGDELPAFDVISMVVPADFVGQLGMAVPGFGVRHRKMFNAMAQRSKAARKRIISAPRALASLR